MNRSAWTPFLVIQAPRLPKGRTVMKTPFGICGYGLLRNGLLVIVFLLSITGLLAASALSPSKVEKPVQFPLSLFKQAEEGDYIGESKCVNCHKPQAAGFERSVHASYVRDPHA